MGRAAKKNQTSTKSKGDVAAMVDAKIAELSVKEELTGEEARELARSTKAAEKEIAKLAEEVDVPLEAKLDSMKSKCLSVLHEAKREERQVLLLKRKSEAAQKEKESAINEMNRALSVKENLETLCRELQRQNKLVMEESKNVAEQEQVKRQELSNKFQDTISDVSTRLDEQGTERIEQFKENERLKEKLKTFAEQYELREQQFAHQLKTKDLEQQLVQAKLNHQQEISKQEGAKLEAYQKELETRLMTEKELRTQLVVYNEKFESFQETLSKSNEVFGSYKKEMEKMSKTIKKQDKENFELKKKAQKCDLELVSLFQERDQYKADSEKSHNQNSSLQSLCKTLQEERKKHLAQLKAEPVDKPVEHTKPAVVKGKGPASGLQDGEEFDLDKQRAAARAKAAQFAASLTPEEAAIYGAKLQVSASGVRPDSDSDDDGGADFCVGGDDDGVMLGDY